MQRCVVVDMAVCKTTESSNISIAGSRKNCMESSTAHSDSGKISGKYSIIVFKRNVPFWDITAIPCPAQRSKAILKSQYVESSIGVELALKLISIITGSHFFLNFVYQSFWHLRHRRIDMNSNTWGQHLGIKSFGLHKLQYVPLVSKATPQSICELKQITFQCAHSGRQPHTSAGYAVC